MTYKNGSGTKVQSLAYIVVIMTKLIFKNQYQSILKTESGKKFRIK